MRNIINIDNGKVLEDPRYGSLVALDVAGCTPLRKLDVAYATVFPGATSPPHFHRVTEEVYFITEGDGIMIIDGVVKPIKPGDSIRIPTYTVHSIRAGGCGVKFMVATSPPYSIDDDVEVDTATVERPARSTGGIAVLIGTHRKESVSARIAKQVAGMYAELGVATDLIDPAELPLELFHPNSFEHRYETDSPLANRLIAARGLHVCVPEYNGSFPGVLKHLLDVQNYERCFGAKAVALVGIAAGDWGGLRAVDQLAAVFQYRSAHLFGKRVFIRNVDEAPFDANGNLADPEIVDRLCAQVRGFSDFVHRLSD
jgi:chromate reductase, NAD(P)H dehydrogenase (quinone)